MISDEPDEDADALDDDGTIEFFLGDAAAKPDGADVIAELTDWPPSRSAHELGLKVDADTLAWFRAKHVDWRRQMRVVLRCWMNAHTAEPDGSRLAARVDRQP